MKLLTEIDDFIVSLAEHSEIDDFIVSLGEPVNMRSTSSAPESSKANGRKLGETLAIKSEISPEPESSKANWNFGSWRPAISILSKNPKAKLS